MTGCVAIDPTATATDPRVQDTGSNTAALNYSVSIFGTSPTWKDNDEIVFTNCSMVDGQGYEWNTGMKASVSTGMPVYPPYMTGNAGAGYARITMVDDRYQY